MTIPPNNPFVLTSPAFREGEPLPDKFSQKSGNLSPHLEWVAPPVGVKSYALICDDPDTSAGTWTHWVIFNIPASVSELPEGIPDIIPASKPIYGAMQGANSSKTNRYDGPRPPSGTHRYYFKLYALDIATLPGLASGAKLAAVQEAITKHQLGMASLMGRFSAK